MHNIYLLHQDSKRKQYHVPPNTAGLNNFLSPGPLKCHVDSLARMCGYIAILFLHVQLLEIPNYHGS